MMDSSSGTDSGAMVALEDSIYKGLRRERGF